MTCGLLVILCMLSFWLPTKSRDGDRITGGRLSLSLSIIISVSLYQLQAASSIPLGTDEIPLMATFLAVMVVLIDFTVIVTLVNMRINFKTQDKPPPRWLFNLLIHSIGAIYCTKKQLPYKFYKHRRDIHERRPSLSGNDETKKLKYKYEVAGPRLGT